MTDSRVKSFDNIVGTIFCRTSRFLTRRRHAFFDLLADLGGRRCRPMIMYRTVSQRTAAFARDRGLMAAAGSPGAARQVIVR
ncbi:hypothetical protein MXD61_13660 [Frankia sp. AgPm24]|uniref:hypothetical protein n=1 Tax=Frankia sp. AgPm24 TaxID=631128 RepID=UPI00200E1180|nr:hypothetical protein [Frankia sp. AgPm24]MCK9922904.1 hypothetical protein [Frankia sp. AgPm24]